MINAIREATLSNMIYFADQRYFPYGVRSVQDLRKIITERIAMPFKPEMIIVGCKYSYPIAWEANFLPGSLPSIG